MGFDDNFNELIQAIYYKNTGDVITGHGITDKFEINQGVHQGDPLSPLIFILTISPIIWYFQKYKGYSLNNINISILAYADDLILISNNKNEIYDMFNILNEYCISQHLSINAKKSAYAWNYDDPCDRNLI